MSSAPAGASASADPAPDAQAAFDALNGQVFADGALSARMKQAVAVAVAHATQCPLCMRGHFEAALEAGASVGSPSGRERSGIA